MASNMIWGNDEKYTKEQQIWYRDQQIKANKELEEKLAKLAAEREKIPEEQRQGYQLRKRQEEMIAKGEIIDYFIKKHLEAKITNARYALAIGMISTVLFKGQWMLWILFIIWYNAYVSDAREKALQADRKGLKRK